MPTRDAAEAGRLALHTLCKGTHRLAAGLAPRAIQLPRQRKEEDSNPRHLSALTLFSRQVRSRDRFSFHENATDEEARDCRRIGSLEPARPARPVSRDEPSLSRRDLARVARAVLGGFATLGPL